MLKISIISLFLLFSAALDLPLTPLATLTKENTWNIVNIGFTNKNQSLVKAPDGSIALKVFYPKGSYKPIPPIGGLCVYASPPQIFATEDATFSYQLYFADNFLPVLGGKLPGLYIAAGTNKSDLDGGSGGIHTEVASVRVMWREKMAAEAYVYLPYDLNQDPSYEKIPGIIRNKQYGDSLWRGDKLAEKAIGFADLESEEEFLDS